MGACDSLATKKDYIVDWMKEKARLAGAKGGILGVSGGIDSALALALAKEAYGQYAYGLVMPCYSLPEDVEDALFVIRALSVDHKVVDLSETYDSLIHACSADDQGNTLAKANIKPRLRMTALYYHASLMNYLVVGTSNKDEIYVGYSTKYGDAGVDIMPLADLTKGEVKEMALLMGIPKRIVERIPSGGLWPGQTDEDELGLTYAELDAYLSGEKISEDSAKRIEMLHKRSEHKRNLPPFPRFENL